MSIRSWKLICGCAAVLALSCSLCLGSGGMWFGIIGVLLVLTTLLLNMVEQAPVLPENVITKKQAEAAIRHAFDEGFDRGYYNMTNDDDPDADWEVSQAKKRLNDL